MIHYDSHKWRTLCRINGSVLPKALAWAFPSAVFAFTLKICEQNGYLSLNTMEVMSQGDIYSGFTFVLGFSLVFRTSQSYLRYWTAATSVHKMGSEWTDSVASLISFATSSKASYPDILKFRHTVVRLFSLLHAMALSEIAGVDQDLPLLDIQGLTKQQLVVLTSDLAQGRKVQIVLSWIKAHIMQMMEQGLLTVPPPILTRVFQELGGGLVEFHKARQIVIWPFPFPYTQLNLLLIQIYTIITPMVVATWQTHAWVVSLFSFVSVTCMIGLDLIASELENPFGDDANDLPVIDLQIDMNKFLTMQLNPMMHTPPELSASAIVDYRKLVHQCTDVSDVVTLDQRLHDAEKPPFTPPATTILQTLSERITQAACVGRGDRLKQQLRWFGPEKDGYSHDEHIHGIKKWLRTPHTRQHGVHETMHPELFPPEYSDDLKQMGLGSDYSPTSSPSQSDRLSGALRKESADNLSTLSMKQDAVFLASETSLLREGSIAEVVMRKDTQSTEALFNATCDRPECSSEWSKRELLTSLKPATPKKPVTPSTSKPATPSTAAASPKDWSQFLVLHDKLRDQLGQQVEVRRNELTSLESLLADSDRLRSQNPRRSSKESSSQAGAPQVAPWSGGPQGRQERAGMTTCARVVTTKPASTAPAPADMGGIAAVQGLFTKMCAMQSHDEVDESTFSSDGEVVTRV